MANVPSGATAQPNYVIGDVAGDVDVLEANAGTANLYVNRDDERNVPWSGPPQAAQRKLTHFRAPGMGDAMWSGACVYDVSGVSPSFSQYDSPSPYADDDGLTYSVTGGIVKHGDQLDVGEPTATRQARSSAVQDSAPAAAFFQGYFNPRWSGLLSGYRPNIQPRPLHANFNPNQMGSKELHKATQYKPVPPMGSLVTYFGSSDKAL